MCCRICFDNVPNTAHKHSEPVHALFDFVTVEGIRKPIAGILRETFPTFSEISKLDVPCVPTFICDSCLKFLLISYKFWIKCSKSEGKIQRILKDKGNNGNVLLQETKRLKTNQKLQKYGYNTCKQNKEVENETLVKTELQVQVCKNSGSGYDKYQNIIIRIEYSVDTDESLFDYLQLQMNDNAILKENETSLMTVIETDVKRDYIPSEYSTYSENLFNKNSCDNEELKKLNNHSDLSKVLQVYLEHRYCEYQFKCEICNLSFPEQAFLLIHIEKSHIHPDIIHFGQAQYQCKECNKKFRTFIAFREHLKLQHDWYRCKVCSKQFPLIEKFEAHVKRNHSGYRPFQCPLCSKLFRTKLLFVEHEKYTHMHEKPYKCQICDKKWINLVNLDMHMRTHKGGKLLNCQFCEESFDEVDSLEQHKKLNHVIKKTLHECDHCLAEFTNLGNLTKHMKTHIDYKAYCCVICDRRFPTLGHLKGHISMKHENQQILICELCNITCLNENDLIEHIEKHSGKLMNC